MSNLTIEDRLTLLEQEVARLKAQVAQPAANGNWIDRVSGSMQDYPEFAEVLEHGRKLRQSERPCEDVE